MQEITRLRALCCECGNLRTVADNYNPPRDTNRTDETSDRDQRGWRCTLTLKCSVCEAKTCHALLRSDDDPFRDIAELAEHERHAAIRQRVVEERGVAMVADALGFKIADALPDLTDEDLCWAEEELHAEAVFRVKSMMRAVTPEQLTLAELGELIPLLRSFLNRRGGAL